MTTAAEKSAIQAAAQATLDLANALAIGPTQEELDTANAQIAALMVGLDAASSTIAALQASLATANDQLATANASIATLQGKVDAARAHIQQSDLADADADAKRAQALADLG